MTFAEGRQTHGLVIIDVDFPQKVKPWEEWHGQFLGYIYSQESLLKN